MKAIGMFISSVRTGCSGRLPWVCQLPHKVSCRSPVQALPVRALSSFVRDEYDAMVRDGTLTSDESQRQLAQIFDSMHQRVASREKVSTLFSGLAVWRSRGLESRARLIADFLHNQVIRFFSKGNGVYVYGGVGIGKSLLMDIFYDTAPTLRKRRVHFHSFMLDVHKKAHMLQNTPGYAGDPMRTIGLIMAKETSLLCFDEFQVTDVGDAMVLKRLFDTLLGQGVVFVATSNRPPDDLYAHGMNREFFLPFIELLKKQCVVFNLQPRDKQVDFRRQHQRMLANLWFSGSHADAAAKQAFETVSGFALEHTGPDHVNLMMGRTLDIPHVAAGVAWVPFRALCGDKCGSSDFLALAEKFHTVVLVGVPSLTLDNHDETRRFIVLVDELYEHRCRLVVTTESAEKPDDVFELHSAAELRRMEEEAAEAAEAEASDAEKRALRAMEEEDRQGVTERLGVTFRKRHHMASGLGDVAALRELSALKDLLFACHRCVSRLVEMQSVDYHTAALTHPVAVGSATQYRPFPEMEKDGPHREASATAPAAS